MVAKMLNAKWILTYTHVNGLDTTIPTASLSSLKLMIFAFMCDFFILINLIPREIIPNHRYRIVRVYPNSCSLSTAWAASVVSHVKYIAANDLLLTTQK